MNISDVTNAKKIGEFYINQAFLKTKDYKRPPKIKLLQTNLINLDFASKENIDDFLNTKQCHVYFFCCDEIIYKIGGSNSSIIDNLDGYYVNQAISGNFSPSRFFCHMKIFANLKSGKKVDAWVINYENVDVFVKNLNDEKKYNVGLNAEELERICKEQHEEFEKKDPEWNLQEDGRSYPKEIQELMDSYKFLRSKKKTKAREDNIELISHFRRCENYNLV